MSKEWIYVLFEHDGLHNTISENITKNNINDFILLRLYSSKNNYYFEKYLQNLFYLNEMKKYNKYSKNYETYKIMKNNYFF